MVRGTTPRRRRAVVAVWGMALLGTGMRGTGGAPRKAQCPEVEDAPARGVARGDRGGDSTTGEPSCRVPQESSGDGPRDDARDGKRRAEPTGEALRGKRVDVLDGEVPVAEFLRFLADSTGRPVIAARGDDGVDPDRGITVAAPIRDADREIVEAILEANGVRVVPQTLPGGREVLRAEPAEASRSVKEAVPVWTLQAGGLRRIEGAPSLVAEGVPPDRVVDLVVPSRDPETAQRTLGRLLAAPRRGEPSRFVILPVQAPRPALVLEGRASRVDRALRILAALEAAGGPRRSTGREGAHGRRRRSRSGGVARSSVSKGRAGASTAPATPSAEAGEGEPPARLETRIVRLRHVDAKFAERLLQALLRNERPGAQRVLIHPHVGTRSLLIQAPEELFDRVLDLLRHIDRAPPAGEGPAEEHPGDRPGDP